MDSERGPFFMLKIKKNGENKALWNQLAELVVGRDFWDIVE